MLSQDAEDELVNEVADIIKKWGLEHGNVTCARHVVRHIFSKIEQDCSDDVTKEAVETPTDPGSAREKAREYIKSRLSKNPGGT